jgi:hypothetical protein
MRGKICSAAALALVAVACGGSSPPVQASCDFRPAVGLCSDYAGALTKDQLALIQNAACIPGGGTWATTACPSAATARVGTCTLSAAGLTQLVHFYASLGLTPTDAQNACVNKIFGRNPSDPNNPIPFFDPVFIPGNVTATWSAG